MIRNVIGRVLGGFNTQFWAPESRVAMSNFAVVGDEIIVLGVNYLCRVKLGLGRRVLRGGYVR